MQLQTFYAKKSSPFGGDYLYFRSAARPDRPGFTKAYRTRANLRRILGQDATDQPRKPLHSPRVRRIQQAIQPQRTLHKQSPLVGEGPEAKPPVIAPIAAGPNAAKGQLRIS